MRRRGEPTGSSGGGRRGRCPDAGCMGSSGLFTSRASGVPHGGEARRPPWRSGLARQRRSPQSAVCATAVSARGSRRRRCRRPTRAARASGHEPAGRASTSAPWSETSPADACCHAPVSTFVGRHDVVAALAAPLVDRSAAGCGHDTVDDRAPADVDLVVHLCVERAAALLDLFEKALG